MFRSCVLLGVFCGFGFCVFSCEANSISGRNPSSMAFSTRPGSRTCGSTRHEVGPPRALKGFHLRLLAPRRPQFLQLESRNLDGHYHRSHWWSPRCHQYRHPSAASRLRSFVPGAGRRPPPSCASSATPSQRAPPPPPPRRYSDPPLPGSSAGDDMRISRAESTALR